jgi:two-component system, sporulation sensor kinase E
MRALLARLGEPFLSTQGEGRGLGILNVKRMVEVVHGGSVDVESETGRGTTVSLIVPRKQPQRAPARSKRR